MDRPQSAGTARPGLPAAHGLALAAVFAAESVVFCVATRHHYAWIYPRWFDQQEYLAHAYGAYRRAAHGGFVQGAMQALSQGSPQGALHGFLALVVFTVAGPSRGAALGVNLAAFLALQAATFLAARRITGSFALGWAAVALLAALQGPWSGGPGSAADFRLDWMAACAFGVALAAALAGNGLRSTPWAVVLGAAVGAAILTRFLTAAYFGLIYGILFSWLLVRPGAAERCLRLLLSGAVALALCAPAFWHARHAIYDYYWMGHFAGPERALRDSHLGWAASLAWIFSVLLREQIGAAAAVLGAAVAASLAILGSVHRFRARSAPDPGTAPADAWVLAAAFLAAPAVVLAAQPQKAPQTVGIMLPGAVWIFLLAWARLGRRARPGAVRAVAAAAFLAGAGVFAVMQTPRPLPGGLEKEYRDVNALSDYLYFRSQEAGLPQPRVAVNWQLDGLRAESFSIVGFERHRKALPFIATLPTGLYATEPRIAMGALADSDFVCLVTRAAPSWPFDRQMAAMLPEMLRWCDAHLRRVGGLDEEGFSVSIYERPTLGRPRGEPGADFARRLSEASRGPAYAGALPPAPPLFPRVAVVLGSTRVDFRYALAAAYSPVRYRAAGLPEGLRLDCALGEIRGRIARPGAYVTRITATNAEGSASADLRFQFEDKDFFAVLGAPARCRAGVPADVGYAAFDSTGRLQFMDVTDLTAGKLLGRVETPAVGSQTWQGAYRVSFDTPGPRTLLMRFVRLDPQGRGGVSFVDRVCAVDVAP